MQTAQQEQLELQASSFAVVPIVARINGTGGRNRQVSSQLGEQVVSECL
jgi:hypothetical protein